MHRFALLIIFVMFLSSGHLAYSAETHVHQCESETAPLMTLKSSWSQLYIAAIALPEMCFDGYFAEGISDTLVRKMGRDWPGFLAILTSHSKDPIFMKLVLRSINATLDQKDIRMVDQLAKTSCKKHLEEQCLAISIQAASALAEINPREGIMIPNDHIKN